MFKFIPIKITFLIVSCAAAAQHSHRVEITADDQYRYIRSNGIPDHDPGQFPNRNNPNTIAAQQHQFRVPLEPKASARITPLGMHPFGVALNGVPFDPGAAEFWNRDRNSGWQYEALSGFVNLGMDGSNAHVQPGGTYHYHGLPHGLIDRRANSPRMLLVGYAADGFPVYAIYGYADPHDPDSELIALRPSMQLKKGVRPSGPGGAHDGTFVQDYEYVSGSGDLDVCNGRVGVTPEYPEGTYYYVLTTTFPFVPRAFRGTPDESFMRHGPPPGGGRRGRPGGGRGGPGPGGGPPPHHHPPPQ